MSYSPAASPNPYSTLDLDLDHDDLDGRGVSPSLIDEPIDKYAIFLPAVQSLVAALGGYENIETSPGSGKFETIYRPGDSVLGVLKDLKKLWRKDDEDDERTVARCMAKAGLMRELVALLTECTDRGDWGRKVALVACDLIAALTWPIDVASELTEMEDEPDVVTDYASLLRAQLEYKALLLQSSQPLRCLLALMLPSLAKPRKDEKDERVISLGLHVVRNLLAIKDTVAEGTATGEKEEFANLQSTLILQLNKLTYFQLLLTLASCVDMTDFNPFNVLVLDVLHLIFRSVKPKDLGQNQDRAPLENLSKLLDAEKRQKALVSKVGMTRHSRFGTTVAVRAGEQKVILHKQNAISANAGKILDEVKRKRAQKAKKVDELTQIVNFSPDAMRALQIFFASILKDIRMERSKVRPSDNVRTFYLTRFFIEYLLVLRQQEEAKGSKEHELNLGLVAEMAEIDSIRWLFSRMKSSMDDKPPAWTELQASLDCFTQILLLLDAMATSGEEEDVEVAEIVQNNLYYNGDILDSSLSVISQYRDQSVAYLDSVIHFAYVLLRMLEKYSKNKAFMFIRKKKAARKKRKQRDEAMKEPDSTQNIPEEYGNEEEEALEPDAEAPSYAEHAFTFNAFEKRFASEPVTNTLLSYLARFQEFEDSEQMKRVVGLMHRQVIKAQAEGLYFKVSTLNLFRKIIDSAHTLPKHDSSKDLNQLIQFVLRKFFKRVAEDPFLIIDAFSSRSRTKWKEVSSYQSGSESDDGMGGQRGRIKEKMGQAEIEFKKNKKLSWSQQMEITVGILMKEEKSDWIKWIIEVLEIALAARTEIVISTDGTDAALRQADSDDEDDDQRVRDFSGPSKTAIDKFVQHDLTPETDSQKLAVAQDSHFRLMLRLLSFDMIHPDNLDPPQPNPLPAASEPTKWFLPAHIVPSSISTSLGALQQYLSNPPELDENTKNLLRRKRPAKKRRSRSPSLDEMDLDSETGELVRRVKQKKIRKKKEKEVQIFKSAAFIEDSDDEDDQATKRFFENEQRLRDEMNALAERQGNIMRANGGKRKRKDQAKKKGKGKENENENGDLNGDSSADEHEDKNMLEGFSQIDSSQLLGDIGMDSDDKRGSGSGSEDESSQAQARRRKRPSIVPLESQLASDDDMDSGDEDDTRIYGHEGRKANWAPSPVGRGAASDVQMDAEDEVLSASRDSGLGGKVRRIVDSDSD
uniref:Topoisomerase 1-associated factor 1 n=1 Tax=Kwoniella dejecticola CBS 10117 TaxID=1296121 RepID=A0A1A5ZUE8_9TREE|nr:topoisomerase 1-associated factor 1 [Kwoniella dejecticola CBS 10117]OBR81432.1 topoisomerase 1-associated factor 1 [Kwoniella dejecticola CBS 10117]